MRRFILFLPLVLLWAVGAHAQSRFSLSVGPTLDNYGYMDEGTEPVNTWYAGFFVKPDWHLTESFGIRVSAGTGWAFSSNTSGIQEKPFYSTSNLSLSVMPYYELSLRKCFFDLGPVLSCRARLPFLHQELSAYVMTVSAYAGVNLRAGYRLSGSWDIFVEATAQRTVYDYLYKSYYTQRYPISGNAGTALGLVYKL